MKDKTLEQRKAELLSRIRSWPRCYTNNLPTTNENLMLKDLAKAEEVIREQAAVIALLEAIRDVKIEEIEKVKEKLEWRPIETAPKDGTWILLCGGTSTEDFAIYREENLIKNLINIHRPCAGKWLEDNGKNDVIESGWVTGFWDGMWYNKCENPTHWMPLPEASKVDQLTNKEEDA